MTDAEAPLPEVFARTREHEYQDPHYHDEDLEIRDDEAERPGSKIAGDRKKNSRRPVLRRRYHED